MKPLHVVGSLVWFVLSGSFLNSLVAETTIWKIENLEHSFYLAGSCHALRATDYPLPVEFDRAYQDSSVVVFETDLDAMNQEENRKLLLSTGLLPQGQTIRSLVAPETYKQYAAHCQSRQLPLENLDRMKPWMLAITLTVVELQKAGIDFKAGMDRHFDERAKKDGKTRLGLVPVKEHIGIISSLESSLDEKIMIHLVEELPKAGSLIKEILDAWRAGDEEKLDAVLNRELRSKYPELHAAFMTDRNKRWIPYLKELIGEKQNTLVIVGSGHLIGSESVLELLTKEGYVVRKFVVPSSVENGM